MRTNHRAGVVGGFLILALASVLLVGADRASQQSQREDLLKTYHAGNFKDAYDGLRRLALDPRDDPGLVGQDLVTAVQCLRQLGRTDEVDAFREAVIAAHKGNWRLLDTAAQNIAEVDHYGFIVAGKFYRGNHRGGGRFVNSTARDRVRALQLMQQALPLTRNENDKDALSRFHLHFADLFLNGAGYSERWRLQYLTDLKQLPDYEEGYHRYGQGTHGAPVDAQGNPVYYHVPKSYEAAHNDGERWRWMLAQAAEFDARRQSEADLDLANFLWQQFGVQTMAAAGFRGDDATAKKAGPFAVHTLSDEETIAHLATGVKRFRLPDEFNWIKIFERVAARGKSQEGISAREGLAHVYENRRQYVKAAAAWKKTIAEYGPGTNNYRQHALDQIVGNWGRFEPSETQPAGKKATVDFRYRNGDKVTFEAFAIRVPKLLDDVRAYLQGHTGQLDWNKIQINQIGYRLVQWNERQYLGEKVASWDLKLKPRPAHVDERITIPTPLAKPGAYLLTAKMADGNTSRIIVWVADTVLVKKQLENQALYYVADAVTGRPVPQADVDFFGWRQVQVQPGQNNWRVDTIRFTEKTDADGQVRVGGGKMDNNFQWLITAKKPKAGPGGADRLAFMGYSYVWFGQMYDPEYNATKALVITDRPVYRPEQTAQFKVWIEHAKYDQADVSAFADQPFMVRIHAPRGDKLFEKIFTTDAYGGLAGQFPLAKGAMLGNYSIQVLHPDGQHYVGGSTFRVEEYKKPEFEVQVEAPREPVRLGEKVTATIRARYYFGAPVTRARVKYKVLRSAYSETWYPRGIWDWMYGRGYWWFAADYGWYPGWHEWGLGRPIPIWWGRPHTPPEVVLENEVEIGPDGVVKVPIDTLPAKELHGDQDHEYDLTAEVVDESRRTIVGTGKVLVARKPFRVFAWVDHGYYRTGDTIKASFSAQTLDQKPVEGKGELTLFQVTYNEQHEPVEKSVETWKLATNSEGKARQQLKAAEPGQYRLSYKLTDRQKHTIEGGYLFVVRGKGFDGHEFRFNDIELVTDKREYAPGDKVKLLINTNRDAAVVLLFLRPTNNVYQPPRVLRLRGKSAVEEVAVVQRDMPNFFIEALTVANGRVYTETREVVVPPEKRVLNVQVLPSQSEYKPGQQATVKVKLTDLDGKPFVGSTVLSVYDKSVEYISGGTNVPDIKEFFWKWQRHHYPQTESSAGRYFGNLLRPNEIPMANLGVFGEMVVEQLRSSTKGEAKNGHSVAEPQRDSFGGRNAGQGGPGGPLSKAALAPEAPGMAPADKPAGRSDMEFAKRKEPGRPAAGGEAGAPPVQPNVRKNFADTALWVAALNTNADGTAEVSLKMPENLTGWKIKVWAMGKGTKVGEGEAEVTTKKDLIVRLQAPRFFVQKDEVVLSANVHNYLKNDKRVDVVLELEGGTLKALGNLAQQVHVPASEDRRVDWRVQVIREGTATIRMKALTDEDSDAMEQQFPCYVHGMLKTESWSGVVRPNQASAHVELTVPAERRINETRLEVRYSPTLAGAMVDALPYLVDYPYGCTEQTLNRFLPTVVTQRVLQRMNLNLKAIEEKRTNLNSQEIGDDKERAKGWKRFDRNPVFDEAEVQRMVADGIQTLAGMQLSDGGWGWFSGFGEHSWPHTTALVVHGLQTARVNGVTLPQGMLERGMSWLQNYQADQVRRLKNAPTKTDPWKEYADNLDAFVYMVLVEGGVKNDAMRDFLYRDRNQLGVYAKAMYGLALHSEGDADKLAMILKNITQYVVQDEENQTAYLKLPADNYWWCWYGSEIEADAYYLKLLSRTSPKDERAAGLVKYLLNNRKHATYWNSTRDTAICIEAMSEYLRASGEIEPNMTIEVWLDGKKFKEVKIEPADLFTFDNKFVLQGDAVDTGKHVLEVKRQGKGPVYFNAYLTNFTLEDFIRKAGLEVKVDRKYYKLTRVDKKIKVEGAHGQAADQKVEKYERTELANLAELKSGDLAEVELEIDSKNDYEYLIFEDPKAAGFEPMEVRSGYNGNDMGAYVEFRDDRVCFFVRRLARGKHSVSYRLRAEIPGRFSALPTRAYAMYAPELKGNSDEIKLRIGE